MGSAPAGFKPPANGRARSGPLAPQRSRGEREGERGFTSGPPAFTDFSVVPPLPNPMASQARHQSVSRGKTFASRNVVPHFMAEREPETAAGSFPTPGLPPASRIGPPPPRERKHPSPTFNPPRH